MSLNKVQPVWKVFIGWKIWSNTLDKLENPEKQRRSAGHSICPPQNRSDDDRICCSCFPAERRGLEILRWSFQSERDTNRRPSVCLWSVAWSPGDCGSVRCQSWIELLLPIVCGLFVDAVNERFNSFMYFACM